jgi:hypothetical protein
MKSSVFFLYKRYLIAIGIIGGLVTLISFKDDMTTIFKKQNDISGKWEIDQTIQQSSLSRYKGLKVSYQVFLTQDGEIVQGNGEKYSENNTPIKPEDRIPVEINGKVDGHKLILDIVEHGKLRETTGQMILTLKKDFNTFTGEFSSTAANSSGVCTGEIIEE